MEKRGKSNRSQLIRQASLYKLMTNARFQFLDNKDMDIAVAQLNNALTGDVYLNTWTLEPSEKTLWSWSVSKGSNDDW